MSAGAPPGENREQSEDPIETDGAGEARGSSMIQWLLLTAGAILFVAGLVVVVAGVPFGSPASETTDTAATPTPSSAATVTPSPSDSPIPTDSPTATDTRIATESPTPTDSPTATESPTPTDSFIVTESPIPTASPTATATPTESEPVDARVVWFYPEQGTYEEGERVSASVTVRNTGGQKHTFFVGYSVFGPNGTEYYNADQEEPTGTTVTLEPDETKTVTVVWQVEPDAPDGMYDALTIVWKEEKRDDLETKLDGSRVDDAFEVDNSSSTNSTSDG